MSEEQIAFRPINTPRDDRTSTSLRIGSRSSRLPTRWLIAIVLAAAALGGWLAQAHVEQSRDHDELVALKSRVDFMWGGGK